MGEGDESWQRFDKGLPVVVCEFDLQVPSKDMTQMFFFFGNLSEDIRKLIENGESQQVEFKKGLTSEGVIARNICAFANSNGGIIIFGVTDDGKIIGVNEAVAARLRLVLQNVAGALLGDGFRIHDAGHLGVQLVYIEIDARGGNQLVATSDGSFYIRQGRQIRVLRPDEMSSLMNERTGPKLIIKSTYRAFVAMSFHFEEHPELQDYYEAMKRAAAACKKEVSLYRMDENPGEYEISQNVMEEIDKADFILADFTFNSHNVYYEVGYAKGRDKNIIRTARKGTDLFFDVKTWSTVLYSNATQLEVILQPRFSKLFE